MHPTDGNTYAIERHFMPREQAEAIAAAWQAHQPKEAYDEEGAPA